MSFPTPTSPLYPLAVAYIKAANDKNSAAIEALLSDDFTAGNHPRTLLTPGMPTRVGRQAYIERGKQMFETVIDYLGVSTHPGRLARTGGGEGRNTGSCMMGDRPTGRED